jgi:hypothetical protein
MSVFLWALIPTYQGRNFASYGNSGRYFLKQLLYLTSVT